MAEKIKGVCTFKDTGVCNCKNKGGEQMATETSAQSTENIKGVVTK